MISTSSPIHRTERCCSSRARAGEFDPSPILIHFGTGNSSFNVGLGVPFGQPVAGGTSGLGGTGEVIMFIQLAPGIFSSEPIRAPVPGFSLRVSDVDGGLDIVLLN